jgi:hypothetical protein
MAIHPDGSRVAIAGLNSGNLSIWDVQKGNLLVTLSGHSQEIESLAWTPDGTRLVSSAKDGTVRVWDTRSSYNQDAELLLDKLSACCLLVEEKIEQLKADSTISPDLRREAIQLATLRGNAAPSSLVAYAWKAGAAPNRSSREYMQALRRVTAGHQITPWDGFTQLTLALLQYRTGAFDQALLESQRAMQISKAQSADAHAVRAMAYYRLHDLARARNELALGLQAARELNDPDAGDPADPMFLEEAQALISPQQAGHR